MTVLVSVNCITYNHEKYIANAIEGFLMQKTNFEYEVLIGEDCSTDNTRKIVESYIEKYPNIMRLITSEKNVGGRQNGRRLHENSRGKYIAICEGDDFWTDPNKLQKQVDYLESHPECTLCFHAANIVNETGMPTGKLVRPYKNSTIILMEDIIAGGGEFCATASLMFLKRTMVNPPRFFLEAHVGDYPMQMWTAYQGTAYYIDEMMSSYRTGVIGSWTHQLSSGVNAIEKVFKALEANNKLLDDFNKETNYKYNEVIEKTKTKKEFEKFLLTNNLKQIKAAKYKVYFDEMSRFEKAKVYSRYYFPKTYAKLINLKRSMSAN